MELDMDYLAQHHRDHVKLWIHPYSSISMNSSVYPEPSGKIKKEMMQGLIDIYDHWKSQLDKTGEDYYLKIWLFDPWFSRSQVVCAYKSCLDFYEDTFYRPPNADPDKLQNQQTSLPDGFNWELRWDEYHISSDELGEADEYYTEKEYLEAKADFEKQLKKPHRTQPSSVDDSVEYHSFKTGHIWLGERE